MVLAEKVTPWWQGVKKNSGDLAALGKYYEVFNRTDGKSLKTVSWYNQTEVTDVEVAAIAKVLGVSIEWLFIFDEKLKIPWFRILDARFKYI